MRRAALLAVLVVVVVAGAACSGDDDSGDSGSPPHRTTTTTSAEATTTTSAGAAPPGYTDEAAANGWRLTVVQPVPGASIGSSTDLCVQIAGPSREADVALDVTLLAPGSTSGGTTAQVDASMGRSARAVSFPDAASGPHDLRVQLIAFGEKLDGVAVTIPGVILGEGAVTNGAPCV